MLIWLVPLLTIRTMLSPFELSECAPAKPKPIMNVSFDLNYSFLKYSIKNYTEHLRVQRKGRETIEI